MIKKYNKKALLLCTAAVLTLPATAMAQDLTEREYADLSSSVRSLFGTSRMAPETPQVAVPTEEANPAATPELGQEITPSDYDTQYTQSARPAETQPAVMEPQAQPQLVETQPAMLDERYAEPYPAAPVTSEPLAVAAAPAATPAYRNDNADNVPWLDRNLEEMYPNAEATDQYGNKNYFFPIDPHYLEAGINYHDVGSGFGNWFGQYVRGEWQTDGNDRWGAELLHQHAFKEDGAYLAVNNVHYFNDKWYTDVAVGVGAPDDAFFLPQFRLDAYVNRRWLPGNNFITTAGLGYSKAQERFSDYSFFLGTTYYFETAPFIFQNGIRYNISSPGSVDSLSGFLALTHGTYKSHFLTGRVDFGREAYQIIGPGNNISDFSSQQYSLDWKQWIDEQWGYRLRGEHYHNPNYDRTGGLVGVFVEF